MQKQKAFDLILKLAIKAPNKGASKNAIQILENLAKHLAPEQVQTALEQYPVKEH